MNDLNLGANTLKELVDDKILCDSFHSWVINIVNIQSDKTGFLPYLEKSNLVGGISQKFDYNLPERVIFPLNFGKYYTETFTGDSCDKNNKQYSTCPCIQNPLRHIR